MKKLISLASLSIFFLFFTSCFKEDHRIRFQNNFSLKINDVNAGNANLGSVNSGETTDYASIATGNFNITGTATNGNKLQGSGSVSGKGKHKWTIKLSSTGGLSISEDK
jgi:hypothetical protein